jgi:hypothetical protein
MESSVLIPYFSAQFIEINRCWWRHKTVAPHHSTRRWWPRRVFRQVPEAPMIMSTDHPGSGIDWTRKLLPRSAESRILRLLYNMVFSARLVARGNVPMNPNPGWSLTDYSLSTGPCNNRTLCIYYLFRNRNAA